VDLGEGVELISLWLSIRQTAGHRQEGLARQGGAVQVHAGAHLRGVAHIQHMNLAIKYIRKYK
jgi:hypothetical protein